MELTGFKRINTYISLVILVISSATYLLTMEPTASFWDCGEFIASSYKLEVGHPPGNPVFQLIARFFTLFGDKDHAAVLVNAMSALCSGLTIYLLYLSIVHLGRRLLEKSGRTLDIPSSLAVFGAGIVGSLAYCYSDTFWFSAVEGEVYAMSSLFTALVFWAMLKWEEQADERYANRWIILIAYLMGVSIGVHLLNLLTIPALVFIYYYKKYEVTPRRTVWVLLISVVILATVLYGIIPYVPKLAAYTDLAFVNGLGLPINSGATFFMLLILGLSFWGIYYTYRHGRVLLNTILLCSTVILIGYSTFAVIVIRSSANTPTNEYQPDNPFTLVRYLAREQYGSRPLIYGETFASPVSELKTPTYYNVLDGKYIKLEGPIEAVYSPESKMLFPRMWQAGADDVYVPFYNMYTEGKGKTVVGSKYKVPTFGANLAYFLDYQLDFMYFRYFMWNFVGRQNDLHSTVPGDKFKGNWESGIGFIDRARLGDQREGPDYIVHSRSKNHYYFLPLLLGLIGLFYQLKKDKHNWVVTMLLFVLTGVAVIVYLNQQPMQPRERDYAYAGSFYAFAIWIGLGVMWVSDVLRRIKFLSGAKGSVAAGAVCLVVPVLMGAENWDDHDRSGRYTSRDMAYNYLMTTDPNAILVTHGDNDTFPLWYIQEVEGVRNDVRVMNTSLLGTDWYIDQMKYRMYESAPVPFSLDKRQYFYGTNDYVHIYERFDKPVLAKEVIEIFKNPKITIPLSDGKNHNYISAKQLLLPVNKENVKKYGIVPEKDYDKIEDTLLLVIPEGKNALNKTELMMLDLLAHYNWDRPLYLLQRGGDINIGIKDYLQYDGYAYKFVPVKSTTGTRSNTVEQMDDTALYDRIMNVYRWDSFADTTINIDYQNLLTFNTLMSPRDIMVQTAKYMIKEGKKKEAVAVLDKMQEVTPVKNFPLNNSLISSLNEIVIMDAVGVYLQAGEKEKAYKLADAFLAETEQAIKLFSKVHKGELMSADGLQQSLLYIYTLSEIFDKNGDPAKEKELSDLLDTYIKRFQEL